MKEKVSEIEDVTRKYHREGKKDMGYNLFQLGYRKR